MSKASQKCLPGRQLESGICVWDIYIQGTLTCALKFPQCFDWSPSTQLLQLCLLIHCKSVPVFLLHFTWLWLYSSTGCSIDVRILRTSSSTILELIILLPDAHFLDKTFKMMTELSPFFTLARFTLLVATFVPNFKGSRLVRQKLLPHDTLIRDQLPPFFLLSSLFLNSNDRTFLLPIVLLTYSPSQPRCFAPYFFLISPYHSFPFSTRCRVR